MWSLSSFGVGVFTGFLFGFPRTVRQAEHRFPAGHLGRSTEAAAPGNSEAPQGIDIGTSANTNLEQISDWLTKIIVGVTLVQFRDIAAYFRGCAEQFATGLVGGGSADNVAFSRAAIVYFGVVSFSVAFSPDTAAPSPVSSGYQTFSPW